MNEFSKGIESVKFKRYSQFDIGISSIVTPLYNKDINRKRRTDDGSEKKHSLENAKRSMRRARANVVDISKCEHFDFFVTLTFGEDRMNDDASRKKFSRWQNECHKMFPQIRYLCVLEYHKKGGLHFHLLVGGVTVDELQLSDSGYVCCCRVPKGYCKAEQYTTIMNNTTPKDSDGSIIYNVGCWENGFSTATKIINEEAVKKYVIKYITKTGIDNRFFNKKRYWSSQNVKRPVIIVKQSLTYLGGDLEKKYNYKTWLDSYRKSQLELREIYYDPTYNYSVFEISSMFPNDSIESLFKNPRFYEFQRI